MLDTGRWVVPQVGGVPYLSKPPLINWLVAAAFRLSGTHSEWAARAPSALAVLGAGADHGWHPGCVLHARRSLTGRDFHADQHRPDGKGPAGRDRGALREPLRLRALPLARRVAARCGGGRAPLLAGLDAPLAHPRFWSPDQRPAPPALFLRGRYRHPRLRGSLARPVEPGASVRRCPHVGDFRRLGRALSSANGRSRRGRRLVGAVPGTAGSQRNLQPPELAAQHPARFSQLPALDRPAAARVAAFTSPCCLGHGGRCPRPRRSARLALGGGWMFPGRQPRPRRPTPLYAAAARAGQPHAGAGAHPGSARKKCRVLSAAARLAAAYLEPGGDGLPRAGDDRRARGRLSAWAGLPAALGEWCSPFCSSVF